MALERPTALSLICALRPFLANTPISTSELEWDEVWKITPKESDRIQIYLDDLGKRIAWVKCPECNSEWNALAPEGRCVACQDTINESAKREKFLGEYLLKALGPYGLERYSFGSFEMKTENAKAASAAKRFETDKDNLYLWGGCGVGKTHLAGAILKEAAARGKRIKWCNSLYISRLLRSRFPSEEEALLGDLASYDVLVIDDLGLARDADTLLRLVYELAEKRQRANRNGWVITSNHNLDELTKKFGDDRLGSRLAGMFKFYHIEGQDDYRLRMRLLED